MSDHMELVFALLSAAEQLVKYANNPPYELQHDPIIPLTPKSCRDLAFLLGKAAAALTERKVEE
jgi:hypothetical protein